MKTEQIIIHGGRPLKGQVSIQGSKNAALPILAATILFDGCVQLHNVPDLLDIRSMLDILVYLGASYTFEEGTVNLDCSGIQNKEIPAELSDKLRASSLVIGPLLGRFGSCEVGMPGGCSIGPRPLNFHFDAMRLLGSDIFVENGVVQGKVKTARKSQMSCTLEYPSVGATENLIMYAVLGKEKITLKNVAVEPEIQDMIRFLQTAGAEIHVDGNTLEIQGIKGLRCVEHRVRADRIEAGTFLLTAFASKGEIKLIGAEADDMQYVLHKLTEMGAKIQVANQTISLQYKGKLNAANVKTAVYPGFPTDLQPQMCVIMTQAINSSMLVENVFDHRFSYIDELLKLNAKIRTEGRSAFIEPSRLSGCKIEGFDLRGTASMIMAGLVSTGTTRVTGLKHLFRGYESFVEKLQHLGADIVYV